MMARAARSSRHAPCLPDDTLGTSRTVSTEHFDALVDVLKVTAAALRDAEIPYAVGGGLAVWAHGGPPTEHDVDVMVRPHDAERAQEVLVAAGMRGEDPPEEWLLKAWSGDVMVDIIFRAGGRDITDEVLSRARPKTVAAVTMPVLSLEDVIVSKLRSMTERALDFTGMLETARAVREQVDWEWVRDETAGLPFAEAYLVLAEGLGVVPPGLGDCRCQGECCAGHARRAVPA